MQALENEIFKIENEDQFLKIALKIFQYQSKNCKVYNQYIKNLKINTPEITSLDKIPFLPIEFFKTKSIKTGDFIPETTFKSSGTTGMDRSKHHVKSLKLYEKSFRNTFSYFYGSISDYCMLALLPSYQEQGNSSLVYMIDSLIKKSNHAHSGFYLYNHQELLEKINFLEKNKQKTILIGVSFALLDFIEKYELKLNSTILIETGGMKGRRKEIVREELHNLLSDRLNLKNIHSEYGMTELLSQAYSKGKGDFLTPPWMKILIRDTYDPFKYVKKGNSGGINIIDLANLYSCSFIETKDIGKENSDHTIKILGRFDNSDIRGCNLMTI